MLSIILHSILAILTTFGVAVFYFILRKGKKENSIMKNIFLFYSFLLGYHLSLILPFLFSGGDLKTMAWGYNLAVVFIFLLVSAFLMVEFSILGFSRRKSRTVIAFFMSICLFVVLLQIYDFRLPVILSSGFILWNANLAAAWITALAGFVAAMIFVVVSLRNWPANLNFNEKLKNVLLVIGLFSFGVSSIMHFPARGFTQILLAFVFIYAGTIFFTAAFLVPKKKELRVEENNESGFAEDLSK
ncbi:MAG: hypothetical protein GXP44_02530 [bacterium]|nr:hypothetical protein [bacterium]